MTELWTVEDIGRFAKYGRKELAKIMATEGFPKPSAPGAWDREEVCNWFKGFTEPEFVGPVQTFRFYREQKTALYRHFGDAGQLLYVGIASDPFRRLENHEHCSPWFWLVTRVEIEWHPNRGAAEEAETKAIRSENPAYNRRDVPRVAIPA